MNAADRPLIVALRGPVTLITVGVLFALNNFTPWGFQQTWPVLLIVFGLLSLMRRAATPPRPYPNAPMPPPPYQGAQPFPPPPYQASQPFPPPSGSYRHSQYGEPAPGTSDTSSGPAKGGFGTSGASNQPESQNPGGAK
jgi:Domain of unknown function (DUF5668)